MSKRQRDYRREYDEYHAKPEQKKRRAARNKARSLAIKKHGKKALEGKEVHHKDYNPRNNSASNLSIRPRTANRKDQPKRNK